MTIVVFVDQKEWASLTAAVARIEKALGLTKTELETLMSDTDDEFAKLTAQVNATASTVDSGKVALDKLVAMVKNANAISPAAVDALMTTLQTHTDPLAAAIANVPA